MKVTVYDKQTGVASQHWPVDVDEIIARGRGRYTVDPNEVEGDVSEPNIEEGPSAEEAAHIQLAEAQHELHEASAALAEHNEAEAQRLQELGEMEARTGEPITPQVYPTHFLDEEQAHYPSDWKYRRHSVSDYGRPQPTAKIKRMPHVSTVYEPEQEKRRQTAQTRAQAAAEAVQKISGGETQPKQRGAAKESKVVSEHKQQLEEKKAAAKQARDERKAQREQERADRKAARDQQQQQDEGQESDTESQ
jgi:hypothetical protein